MAPGTQVSQLIIGLRWFLFPVTTAIVGWHWPDAATYATTEEPRTTPMVKASLKYSALACGPRGC